MIEFVEGEVRELTPTYVVIKAGGLGYKLHISLSTFDKIKEKKNLSLFSHLSIKEDSHTLFGFAGPQERLIFRELISVNGIGTATARMVLSSLSEHEVLHAILNGNIALLKSIKGIGPKAAQRMVLELQDKFKKIDDNVTAPAQGVQVHIEDAVEALTALGFARRSVEKVLIRVTKDLGAETDTEELIKKSLKLL
jgi:holliday junction DNA helicase RuvA